MQNHKCLQLPRPYKLCKNKELPIGLNDIGMFGRQTDAFWTHVHNITLAIYINKNLEMKESNIIENYIKYQISS